MKLFRKIRQSLLQENRFTKYLLYALGEIVLVVIGILIALQINNLNGNRMSRQKELVLLTEMRQNLESDRTDLGYNISGNTKLTQSNKIVKIALENKIPFHDSLNVHFGNIFGNFQLVENTSAWENLKSVGLDLISNDSLRNRISSLYSTRYIYLENLEKNLDDKFQFNYVYPQVLKHFFMEGFMSPAKPNNYEKLLEDEEFLEIIKMNINIREVMQHQYEEVRVLINSLLDQMDSHLKHLEK